MKPRVHTFPCQVSSRWATNRSLSKTALKVPQGSSPLIEKIDLIPWKSSCHEVKTRLATMEGGERSDQTSERRGIRRNVKMRQPESTRRSGQRGEQTFAGWSVGVRRQERVLHGQGPGPAALGQGTIGLAAPWHPVMLRVPLSCLRHTQQGQHLPGGSYALKFKSS